MSAPPHPPSTGVARWERVRTLFDELVSLDAGERAKRLESLGASAPDLRHAVEAMLSADAAADARLASVEAPFLPAPDPQGTKQPDSRGRPMARVP